MKILYYVLLVLALTIAVLLIASNKKALTLEGSEKAEDQRLRRRCQKRAIFLTVALVIAMFWVQRTAQEVAGEHLAAQLQVIATQLKDSVDKQEKGFERQAAQQKDSQDQLDRTLAEAQKLGQQQKQQTAALERQQGELQGITGRQSGELKLLNRIPLNRNLLGIEISYSPTKEKWDRIAIAYRKVNSPEPDLPYDKAPLLAERDGDHWLIDFEPAPVKPGTLKTRQGVVIRTGGNKKLHKLSTRDNRFFEDVLKEALIGLRIVWGNNTETVLNAEQDYLPSAMYVSQNEIRIILRPPLVVWNLNELNQNASVKFFGKDYPIDLPETFTIRSLDPGVSLNETITLNWQKRPLPKPPDFPPYDQQVNRKESGPHHLKVRFNEIDAITGLTGLGRNKKPN